MPLSFEITRRSYAIEIEDEPFLNLLDSESYVSGNAAYQPGIMTLSEKLDKLPGVYSTNYDGHFGGAIYLDIEDEHDTDELKTQIRQVVEEHLEWCSTLPKADHVVQRRRGP